MRLRWLAMAGLVLMLGGCSGLREGESCDVSLGNRDCQEDLVCAVSYDECTQYGCAKCRRPCSADDQCANPDQTTCEDAAARRCVFGTREDFRGVCRVCPENNPWTN